MRVSQMFSYSSEYALVIILSAYEDPKYHDNPMTSHITLRWVARDIIFLQKAWQHCELQSRSQ